VPDAVRRMVKEGPTAGRAGIKTSRYGGWVQYNDGRWMGSVQRRAVDGFSTTSSSGWVWEIAMTAVFIN
jgi:hypothetical protein